MSDTTTRDDELLSMTDDIGSEQETADLEDTVTTEGADSEPQARGDDLSFVDEGESSKEQARRKSLEGQVKSAKAKIKSGDSDLSEFPASLLCKFSLKALA